MEVKKSKIFTKRLISLVLALVMAVSGFFGVAFTAQAYQKSSTNPYNDSNLDSTLIGWVNATDDQTLEALLDYADDFLANMDWDGVSKKVAELDINGKIPSALNSFATINLTLDQFPHVVVKVSTGSILNMIGLSINVNIDGYVDSIDGILKLMFDVNDAVGAIRSLGKIDKHVAGYDVVVDLSEIGKIDLSAFGTYFHESNRAGSAGYMKDNSFRANNSAKYIIQGILKVVKDNQQFIKTFLDGDLDLIPNSYYNIGDGNQYIVIDLYGMFADLLGVGDWEKTESHGTTLATYQNDNGKGGNGIIYNVLKALIVKNVPIYDEKTQLKYEESWDYDTEAYRIVNYYLQKISFEITYPERVNFGETTDDNFVAVKGSDGKVVTGWREDSSKRRYLKALKANKVEPVAETKATKGLDLAKINSDYATQNGWDPNLYYSTSGSYAGNVVVTKYGNQTLTLDSTQSIMRVVMQALPILYNTCLKPTINLLHVNYDRGSMRAYDAKTKSEYRVSNFDNEYYYWMTENKGWNYSNWKSNYSEANFDAYAKDAYTKYKDKNGKALFASADDFKAYVENDLEFSESRVAKKDAYNWRDIDASILFQEIRYSPLVDLVFGKQTGPLNLYFAETGAPTLDAFFKSINGAEDSAIGRIDDGLIAAVGDFFPASEYGNIGKAVKAADGTISVNKLSIPTLQSTDDQTSSGVVAALINQAAAVLQYVCDTTDGNLLEAFYQEKGDDAVLSESNVEQAVVPFIISALKHWSLTASIHNADWDKVSDLESMAVVSLQEYLRYIYPDRDYSDLWTTQKHTIAGTDKSYDYIVSKSSDSLLNTAIIPMSGDAILFVLNAAGVPVFKQTSNASVTTEGYKGNSGGAELIYPDTYTFKDKGTGYNNLIFQTLNGILCYFAVDKGIAGLCNLEGKITKTQSIWQNADAILSVFPILANVFPDASDNSSTIDLKTFVDKVVAGVTDVGQGKLLSNVFTWIGDLGYSEPIVKTTAFDAIAINLVKPIVNQLFGSRNGTESNIITYSEGEAGIINSFLKDSYIIDIAVMNLINNVYDVLTSSSAYTDSTYKALTAGLCVTQLIPKIKDNRIGGVEATLADNMVESTSIDTKLNVRNASWGFAAYYKQADRTNTQRSRYDATINSYQVLDENGNDVTSRFTIAADNTNSNSSVARSYIKTGSLPAEAYTRVTLKGTAPANGLYNVVVNYSMNAKDGSVSYDNLKAVDFLYVGSKAAPAWSEAYSGKNIKSDADASLVDKQGDENGVQVITPKYVGLGRIPSSSGYTYRVANKTTSAVTATNIGATVAENTPNYYVGTPGNGELSTDADPDSYYVALDQSGYVIKADGQKVLATSLYKDAEGNDLEDTIVTGYRQDKDGKVVALTVSEPADYKPGTPIAGVYLNVKEDGDTADAWSKDDPEVANVKLISNESETVSDADYAPMGVKADVDGEKLFTTIISTGDIDGFFSNYKNTARGLAVNYLTSSDSSAYNTMRSDIVNAIKSTVVFSGINADNIAANINDDTANEDLYTKASKNPTVEVQNVKTNVIEERRNRVNIDYTTPSNYEKAVDLAQEAEKLVSGVPQTTTNEDGEEETVKTADGYEVNDYYSTKPAVQLREAVRTYRDLYEPQATLKSFDVATTGKLITDEVKHATSACDSSDSVVASTANAYTDFTATKVANSTHQFAYSTKPDEEKQYDTVDSYTVKVTKANPTLKFGAVDSEGNLVNKGAKTYTAESWHAYVDALGECIDAINNKSKVSDTYEARSHLVIAENNLEEGSGEEPTGDNITISGTVYISQNETGSTGSFGARGIKFQVNGEDVTDADGNVVTSSSEAGHYGEFTISVPKGTTEITLTSDSSVDRTVTLSGTSDITGASIKIVTADYNRDTKVNASDFSTFKRGMGGSEVKFDLNNDGKVNGTDFTSFKKLMGKTIKYTTQSLD